MRAQRRMRRVVVLRAIPTMAPALRCVRPWWGEEVGVLLLVVDTDG